MKRPIKQASATVGPSIVAQLTPEILARVEEDILRSGVLVPLFKAMGFQAVHEYHGTHEVGKDIVMWKADELGTRVNYGVFSGPSVSCSQWSSIFLTQT